MSEDKIFETRSADEKLDFTKVLVWLAYFCVAGGVYFMSMLSRQISELMRIPIMIVTLGFLVFVGAAIYAFMEGVID